LGRTAVTVAVAEATAAKAKMASHFRRLQIASTLARLIPVRVSSAIVNRSWGVLDLGP
jgi:hypothetical protein